MYQLETISPWYDLKAKKWINGGKSVINDSSRVQILLREKVVRPVGVFGNCKDKKKVLLFMTDFLGIGGIETAVHNLVRAFPNRITIVCRKIDAHWFLEIGKYADIVIDPEMLGKYEADVAILTQFDTSLWLDNFEKLPKKVYQQVHADYSQYEKIEFDARKYLTDERITKLLPVSEAAKSGLKKRYNLDSLLLPNAVKPVEKPPLLIGYFSRATKEKNPEGLVEFIKTVNAQGFDAEFLICSTTAIDAPEVHYQLSQFENVCLSDANHGSPRLISKCDYIVQLSIAEASCEVVREALDNHVPVIVSDIPAFEYIKDGVLGYHWDGKPETLKQIFENKPKITDKEWKRTTDKLWSKVIGGTL